MLTVSEVLDLYYREHVADKVVARDRVEYAIHALKAKIGYNTIHSIDIPACRRYEKLREADGVSPSTVRRELGTLQAAANHCLRWRHLAATEMPSIELPDEGEGKLIWLYKDELKQLAAAADENDPIGRFIRIAYYSAGRKRSVETLEWSTQIDLAANRISLAKPGEKKTKKRRPVVPIHTEIQERMRRWYDARDNDWVLGTGKCLRYRFDQVALAADLLELPQRGLRPACVLTPHALRHSRATHLLQDGKNPYAVANLLGDSLKTVLRVYGHFCPDYLSEAL